MWVNSTTDVPDLGLGKEEIRITEVRFCISAASGRPLAIVVTSQVFLLMPVEWCDSTLGPFATVLLSVDRKRHV